MPRRKGGSSRASAPPRVEHHARAHQHDAGARARCRQRGLFPLLRHLAPGTRCPAGCPRRAARHASVAVVADGRAAQQHRRRPVQRGNRRGQRGRAAHAAVPDRRLAGVGPALRDRLAREVSPPRHPGQGRRVQRATRRIPRHVAGLRPRVERTRRRTMWPWARSRSTSAAPISPVAPETAMMVGSARSDSFVVMLAGGGKMHARHRSVVRPRGYRSALASRRRASSSTTCGAAYEPSSSRR